MMSLLLALLLLLLLLLLAVPTVTAIDNPSAESDLPLIQCFRTQSLNPPLRCTNRDDMPSKSFRNVQIIGSFKTGTSAMYGLVNKYPNVVEASAELNGKQTGPEISFMNTDADIAGGYKRYEGFFDTSFNNTVSDRETILLEKSPVYAYDTLAPFRAAAMLPRTTKYIYTIRNSTEADVRRSLTY
jgi:hypothetical protein